MLRQLIILGVCAGTSMLIPVAYQANPQAFHALLRPGVDDPSATPKAAANTVRPKTPAQPETLTGRKVRLTADPRGHFLADFKLNGRRIEALVDTGATAVAINASTARRIGLSLKSSDFRHSVNTANGETRAAAVMIDRIEIGRIYLENIEAAVLDDKALSGTLIGMSFLKRLGKFEIENGTLLLVQ
ncbi:TIGR02281 family clan AA aspartic protease [Mesorhizobium sp. WSM2239]|uniref:TIGR02281 family clan AA aspartic protease n=2 Tax=unclassified Mesorhizobium TaxID=325217 RepID=A0AAU8DFL9_9HYPH